MPSTRKDKKPGEAKDNKGGLSPESGGRSLKNKFSGFFQKDSNKEIREINAGEPWAPKSPKPGNGPSESLVKTASRKPSLANLVKQEGLSNSLPAVPRIPTKLQPQAGSRSESPAISDRDRSNVERARPTTAHSGRGSQSTSKSIFEIPPPATGQSPGTRQPSPFQAKRADKFEIEAHSQTEILAIFETLRITVARTIHLRKISQDLSADNNLPEEHTGERSVVPQTFKHLLLNSGVTAVALLQKLDQHELIVKYNEIAHERGIDDFQHIAEDTSHQAQVDFDSIITQIATRAATKGKTSEGKRRER